jgi:hypothetical protein
VENKDAFRVIFLDFDGVLNNRNNGIKKHKALLKKYHSEENIPWHKRVLIDNPTPYAIKCLNKIISKTNAQIVLSSSWRYDAELIVWNKFFAMCGLKGKICGKTENLQLTRGAEIDDWIRRNPLTSFVILDDDDDMKPHFTRLVLCNEEGLTKREADIAIAVLFKEYKND